MWLSILLFPIKTWLDILVSPITFLGSLFPMMFR